jgi:hypothetical protein
MADLATGTEEPELKLSGIRLANLGPVQEAFLVLGLARRRFVG